ncbi:MAG: hypothetical protein RJA10_1461, partial [Pseudomonadota bacterium]
LREGRPLAAAEAWARAADERAQRAERSPGWQSVPRINALAAAAFGEAGDARAYARWALSVQQYLEAGSSWPVDRAELADRVRTLERQLGQVAGDVPPNVTIEDRMLLDLWRRLALAGFNGPRSGLAAATATVSAQMVTPQYFAGAAGGDAELRLAVPQARYALPRAAEASARPAATSNNTAASAAAPAARPEQPAAPAARPVQPAAPAVEPAQPDASAGSEMRLRGGSATAAATAAPERRVARAGTAPPRLFAPSAPAASLLTPALEMAARNAWRYVLANRQANTGLVNGKDGYPVATMADVAHGLAALLAARELGLVEPQRVEAEARQVLAVLLQLPLYASELFNREYDTRSGRMLDIGAQVSTQGSGWSAEDHGRLLLWLRVLSREVPVLAGEAARVVERLRLGRLVGAGRLQSALRTQTGETLEGDLRLGAQQLTAAALWLWGIEMPSELGYAHAHKRKVGDLLVPADVRAGHAVAPEAFARGLLELGGLDGCFEAAARLALDAQHALARANGRPVMVATELLDRDPWFVNGALGESGLPWFVASFDRVPRPELATFSVKAAYLWSAVDRSAPTLAARGSAENLEQSERGLYGGRYSSGRTNLALTLETNASVLVAAWHARRGGQPILPFDNPSDVDCPALGPSAEPRP